MQDAIDFLENGGKSWFRSGSPYTVTVEEIDPWRFRFLLSFETPANSRLTRSAYIFELNGLPPGAFELRAEESSLARILIERRE